MEEDSPLFYKITIVNNEHDRFCQLAQGGDGSMPSPYTRHSLGKFTEVHGRVCKRVVSSRCTIAAGLGDGFATLSVDEALLHRPYMMAARCWQEKRAFFLPSFQELADQLEREVVEKVTNWLLSLSEVRLSLPTTCAFLMLELFLLVITLISFNGDGFESGWLSLLAGDRERGGHQGGQSIERGIALTAVGRF